MLEMLWAPSAISSCSDWNCLLSAGWWTLESTLQRFQVEWELEQVTRAPHVSPGPVSVLSPFELDTHIVRASRGRHCTSVPFRKGSPLKKRSPQLISKSIDTPIIHKGQWPRRHPLYQLKKSESLFSFSVVFD